MIKLFLMTQKGYEVLTYIVKMNYSKLILSVVGSGDSNLVNDYYNEIKNLCDKESIRFVDKKNDVSDNEQYSIAISWRWIIKDAKNLIVLHDSLLPRYRGFAPLVNCLKNGERRIGVTALFASEHYDRGNIITCSSIEISYPIKIQQAIDKITSCYNECIDHIMLRLRDNMVLNSIEQNELDATYSLWLNNDDYRIDWTHSNTNIRRFVDAVCNPYAGAFTTSDGLVLRILDVEEVDDVFIENRTPGKIIFIFDGFPVVVCGKGLLKITSMIFENGSSAIPQKKFRTHFV